MLIDKELARETFRRAVEAQPLAPDHPWLDRIRRLSAAAEPQARTHIAFIGTALLAKATEFGIDARTIKANSGPKGYSARAVATDVLVPESLIAGVDLGVSGREPLNNQPYFQLRIVDSHATIHASARQAFDVVLELLEVIDQFTAPQEAFEALAAFVQVRKREDVAYPSIGHTATLDPRALLDAIGLLSRSRSEGGRRAQAIVAGLLDVVYSPARVDTGRINDPSRHYPGDVAVWSADRTHIEKAFEVRDKPVSESDAMIFMRQAHAAGIHEAIVVACSLAQPQLDHAALVHFASPLKAEITVFYGWNLFVHQALLWAGDPQWQAAGMACSMIEARLVQIECSVDAIHEWRSYTARAATTPQCEP